jgi:hypothetical protein
MYFSSTQHNVSGPFLDYWRTHDGAMLLGAPLSEPIADVEQQGGPAQAYTLQYFERGALAYQPVGPTNAFTVTRAPIGDVLLRQRGWLP